MPEAQHLRCKVCGASVGFSTQTKPLAVWCSEACLETPVARTPSQIEIRDEVACELFLQGLPLRALVAETGINFHQQVQQVLQRRGITSSVREEAKAS